jgi:hypothetical protein
MSSIKGLLLFSFQNETKALLNTSFGMKQPEKPKRKRIAVKLPPLIDGTNTPVPVPNAPRVQSDSESDLYKQANNPLGDPHKI